MSRPEPRRRSKRHPTYDYSEPGAYFVTICVQDRRHAFGSVRDDLMILSAAGKQAESCLGDLEERFPTTMLDCFVIMPNHVHAVIVLGAREQVGGEQGAMNRVATVELDSGHPPRPKLGEIVRVFKAVSTRAIRACDDVSFAWQSDFHDRIIRTERELAAIRDYVVYNPVRWVDDTFNDACWPTLSPSPPRDRG